MILDVKNLTIEFDTLRGKIKPVEGMSFTLNEGESLGIVGESGSGKSLTSLAVMGLLPETAQVTAEKMNFQGRDLLNATESELRGLRGGDMAMIFQDPMTSLNPSFTVGFQIMESLQAHGVNSKEQRLARARELLSQVGIPDPDSRLNAYPYQLSGGMSQRVMIAMSIACRPKLLIADEPTTALDVTIQAQILHLLKKLQKENKMSLILITHDIGVVSEMADRIAVMYAGEVVEMGSVDAIMKSPQHPYTKGLLECLPGRSDESLHRTKLPSIPGLVPDLTSRPSGCQFHPRCFAAQGLCSEQKPVLKESSARHVRCHFPLNGEVK